MRLKCKTLPLILLLVTALCIPVNIQASAPEVTMPAIDVAGQIVVFWDLRGESLLAILSPEEPDGQGTLAVFDAGTGVLRASIALPVQSLWENALCGFLPDGRIYTLLGETPEASIYTADLSLVGRIQLPAGYQGAYVSVAGLWGNTDTQVTLFPLDGTAPRTYQIALPDWSFDWITTANAETFTYLQSSRNGYRTLVTVTLETGHARFSPIAHGMYLSGNGLWISILDTTALLALPEQEGTILRVSDWNPSEFPLSHLNGQLLTANFGEASQEMRILDLNRGGQVASIRITDSAESLIHARLSADGFAMLLFYDESNDTYVFKRWDWPDGTAIPLTIDRTTIADMRREAEDTAAAVGARHGVHVYLGMQADDFYDAYYAGRVSGDWQTAKQAAEKLDAFLSRLPEGMIGEALMAPYTSLAFYLSSSITRIGEGGIDAPAGFASYDASQRYIVLDMAQILWSDYTFAHEWMHVLEDRLMQADNASEGALFAGWDAIAHPSGELGYYYSYRDENGLTWVDVTYTGDDLSSGIGDQTYYVDAYARTYPIEDRARIFEHLFAAEDHLPQAFEGPHLMEKARYLCKMLREGFPSVRNAAATPVWERFVGEPAASPVSP